MRPNNNTSSGARDLTVRGIDRVDRSINQTQIENSVASDYAHSIVGAGDKRPLASEDGVISYVEAASPVTAGGARRITPFAASRTFHGPGNKVPHGMLASSIRSHSNQRPVLRDALLSKVQREQRIRINNLYGQSVRPGATESEKKGSMFPVPVPGLNLESMDGVRRSNDKIEAFDLNNGGLIQVTAGSSQVGSGLGGRGSPRMHINTLVNAIKSPRSKKK